MKKFLAVVLILFATQVTANEERAKAQFKVCAACHGAQAQGMGGFPNLAVQAENDLIEALTDYKNMATRGDMSQIMWGQVQSLSDDDIKAISKYIVSEFGSK